MTSNSDTIVKKNKELKGYRDERRQHEKALEAARADQAKARGTVMQKEKVIKKTEKTLDARVCFYLHIPFSLLTSSRNQISSHSKRTSHI